MVTIGHDCANMQYLLPLPWCLWIASSLRERVAERWGRGPSFLINRAGASLSVSDARRACAEGLQQPPALPPYFYLVV
jgi:hypothetical protein